MATRKRQDDRRSAGAPNLVPVFATIVVVVVAALAVAVMTQPDDEPDAGPTNDEPTTEDRRRASSSAFGDIDTTPSAVSRGGSSRADRAPAGIDEAADFQEGRELAAAGKALLDEAQAAQKAGNGELYVQKATAAREKYERAMEVTADWEIGLITEYGSDDRQVARIGREIDGWRKQLNKVRKVH